MDDDEDEMSATITLERMEWMEERERGAARNKERWSRTQDPTQEEGERQAGEGGLWVAGRTTCGWVGRWGRCTNRNPQFAKKRSETSSLLIPRST